LPAITFIAAIALSVEKMLHKVSFATIKKGRKRPFQKCEKFD
jgi:hypothetical protein